MVEDPKLCAVCGRQAKRPATGFPSPQCNLCVELRTWAAADGFTPQQRLLAEMLSILYDAVKYK